MTGAAIRHHASASGVHESSAAAEAAIARSLLGESLTIRRVRALIARVAPSTLPVLLQGESGTGKELAARAIHAASGRSGPFVALNVCAVNESVFESALFGHVRGAFTGAVRDTRGFLAEADRGTAFLDEISGLALPMQAKLLRAIETQEFRPVGAERDRRSDFRVVAATNEDLAALVERRCFRADLAYRLRGMVIVLPPLRDRVDDVPLLARHFAATCESAGPARLSEAGLRRLQRHHWPGNVRQLRNVVTRALVLAPGWAVGAADIDRAIDAEHVLDSTATSAPVLSPAAEAERLRLIALMEAHHWDTAAVARVLEVTRKTVYERLRRLGIPIPQRYRPKRSAGCGADSPAAAPTSATAYGVSR